MGGVFSLYDREKKKIEKKHTINGKLSPEGAKALFRLAQKYGIARQLYYPSDSGTKSREERN